MQTMTALVIPSAHDQTLAFAEVAVPEIAANELLVEIKAIGVGIHDSYFLPDEPTYPYPIGIEASGLVAQVGPEVTGHAPGDRIAFVSSMQPKGGVWAQYAAVRSDSLIVAIPDGMSFEQVAASASPHNHDYLRSLGATLVVDYRDAGWPEQVRQWRPDGVDGALAVQPQTTVDSARVLTQGGTVVTVSGDQDTPPGVQVTGLAYQVDIQAELMSLMADVVAGEIRLVIEGVHPFTDALTALAKVQTRHARGKTVLSLA